MEVHDVDVFPPPNAAEGGVGVARSEHVLVQQDSGLVQGQALGLVHRQGKGILDGKLATTVGDAVDGEDYSCRPHLDGLQAITCGEGDLRDAFWADGHYHPRRAIRDLSAEEGVVQVHDAVANGQVHLRREVDLPSIAAVGGARGQKTSVLVVEALGDGGVGVSQLGDQDLVDAGSVMPLGHQDGLFIAEAVGVEAGGLLHQPLPDSLRQLATADRVQHLGEGHIPRVTL